MTRRLIILGSTGSIGTQALDVVAHINALHASGDSPIKFEVVGLAAGRNENLLREQARRFGVNDTSLADGGAQAAHANAEDLVRRIDCDLVLAAMVGVAGLPATLAAVELGRDVALANKETLVAAGSVVIPAARKSNSRILPVDSEHSGVWQCLGGSDGAAKPGSDEVTKGGLSPRCPPHCDVRAVERVILTASGGPFRTWTKSQIDAAAPQDALKHPTWSMGPKVTIDSASLMNKALELIEAHWLFGLPPERLAALIHPQSIVHSFVEYKDGGVIAQLGAPDMRLPIQHALTHPFRVGGCAKRIAWHELSKLEFEPIDPARFPAPASAFDAIRAGGTAGAILNAANEEAVRAFLEPDAALSFGWIVNTVRAVTQRLAPSAAADIGDILRADDAARRLVRAEPRIAR